MNKCILMGRLTADPECKAYGENSDKTMARYTLAVDSGFGDNKRTDFIRCTAFGRNGAFAEKYLRKGMRMLINGELHIDNVKDNDGNTKTYAGIVVESQEFAEGKREEANA